MPLPLHLQGLGLNLDWYQERTGEDAQHTVGGWATAATYDWSMLGSAFGAELDWASGSDVLHVDVNIFDSSSYKWAWLLLLPAANYARDLWRCVWPLGMAWGACMGLGQGGGKVRTCRACEL